MDISTLVRDSLSGSPSLYTERESEGEVARRRRGAPVGNKNAARHGLYSVQNRAVNMEVLKDNTDLGRADREIFLTAWQVSEVAGMSRPINGCRRWP